jgi:hypothetical protein
MVVAITTATISLKDLTIVVRNNSGVTIHVWPVGVGGYKDKELLTPTMDGWLFKNRMKIRTESYYKQMPFIRILDKRGGFTTLGLHVTPYDKLRRGYVSHGCIHMRPDDLRALVDLLKRERAIRLQITLEPSGVGISYPYAIIYYRYKDFGTKAKPEYRKDKYGLEIMEPVKIRRD